MHICDCEREGDLLRDSDTEVLMDAEAVIVGVLVADREYVRVTEDDTDDDCVSE
jgi:hypothetical protein